jgi:hypothetical protein
MSSIPPQNDLKMLPGESASTAITPVSAPPRQLSELPKDELEHLAEEFGLDTADYKTRQHLVAAIHDRRQMIAATDRDAMLDVVKWGRRPVSLNASKEQLAQEIARIRSMRFGGLSQRGLVVLARLRGLAVPSDAQIPILVKKLKKQEGFFSKLNRKRRAMLGSFVSGLIGDNDGGEAYQFLPPSQSHTSSPRSVSTHPSASPTIKEEIEESGLFGGIAGRIKKSADSYVNHKLDEIESRIDRKLDEIDRRLAEWRDKEIANRIRILKITLWASVIVGAFSLLYAYIVSVSKYFTN